LRMTSIQLPQRLRTSWFQYSSAFYLIPFSLSVTLSILGNAIGNLLWATYCGYCTCIASGRRLVLTLFADGRRPIFLFSLPTLFIASLGVASAHSVPSLLVWRLLQAFGCSSGMSVGASVIGDIYKMEERGTAMGVFFGVS
jgi:MFS family permease